MTIKTRKIPDMSEKDVARFNNQYYVSEDSFYNDEPCWIWMSKLDKDGYGSFSIRSQQFRAHRVGYELYNARPSQGLPLDHLCRNRACVNGEYHLEAVTTAVNNQRGKDVITHCPRGHLLAGANLVPSKAVKNLRSCRACDNSLRRLRDFPGVDAATVQKVADSLYAEYTAGA